MMQGLQSESGKKERQKQRDQPGPYKNSKGENTKKKFEKYKLENIVIAICL